MKRSLLKITSMFLLIVLCIPNIFATNLDSSSKIVTVGTVEDTDEVIYDVQIEWGNMIFDFIKTDGELEHETYFWKARSGYESSVTVTNMSSVAIKAEASFTPSMREVIGNMECYGMGTQLYSLANEKPEGWEEVETRYYEFVDGKMIPLEDGTEFVPGKFYFLNGAGGNGLSFGDIPGMTNIDGQIEINSKTWRLSLEGGSLSEIRPGATIGIVTVTLS